MGDLVWADNLDIPVTSNVVIVNDVHNRNIHAAVVHTWDEVDMQRNRDALDRAVEAGASPDASGVAYHRNRDRALGLVAAQGCHLRLPPHPFRLGSFHCVCLPGFHSTAFPPRIVAGSRHR